ncbi:reticulon-1 isoform X1 [Arapaima gigas]
MQYHEGKQDADLVSKPSKMGDDLYTSLLSDQSYSLQQAAPYLSGNLKLEKGKILDNLLGDQTANAESQSIVSTDSAIDITPCKSIDMARNLLESERMQAYDYMDISHREDPLGGQNLPLEDWGEVGMKNMESHSEKEHLGAEDPLTLILESHVEDPTEELLADQQVDDAPGPRTTEITEPPGTTSSPEHHPIIMSERESILSLGLKGIPTVTLSEPMEDSPDSSTDEGDSLADIDLQLTEEAAETVATGDPTDTPAPPGSQHANSIQSCSSEIELMYKKSPLEHEKPTSTSYASSGPVDDPTSDQTGPPIQYSILREEREAELDSELVIEVFDESPKREGAVPSPRNQKAKPSLATTPSTLPSAISSSTVNTAITKPFTSNMGHQFMNEKDPVEVKPPTTMSNTGVHVEQPTMEEKVGKQRRASQGRRGSDRRASLPVFLWEVEQQKAVDLLYWRDMKKTGLLLGAMLLLLLSLTQFSVVSVGAYLALAVLSATISFRIYKSVLQAVQKTEEGHPFKSYLEMDIALSQEQMQKYAEGAQHYISCMVKELRRLFLVQDLVDSLKFAVLMWLLTYVGALFNGLTLLIMVVVSMFSMPVVYEKYQAQIDQYLGLIRTHVNCVVGKIQEKIPGVKRKTE